MVRNKLTDYRHVGMIGNRLKSWRFGRHFASIPPGTGEIHVIQDDGSFRGMMRLKADKKSFTSATFTPEPAISRTGIDAPRMTLSSNV